MKSVFDKIQKIYTKCERIVDSDLTWDEKYDLIFSEEISKTVHDLIKLDYYDPDTSYEVDVQAFVQALKDKVARMAMIDSVCEDD